MVVDINVFLMKNDDDDNDRSLTRVGFSRTDNDLATEKGEYLPATFDTDGTYLVYRTVDDSDGPFAIVCYVKHGSDLRIGVDECSYNKLVEVLHGSSRRS